MFEQAYADGVMAIHLRGEVDVIATYREVYADSCSVDEAGSDEELIRACAVLDYDDGATGGACFQALWDSLQQQSEPKPETLWQHHNGGVYRVLHIANQQTTNPDKYPVTVVYQGVVNDAVWTRVNSETAEQWNELRKEIGSDGKPARTKETLAYAISVAHSITCGVRRTDDMGLILREMAARWDDRQAIDDLLYEALELVNPKGKVYGD